MSRHLERLIQIDQLIRSNERYTAASMASVLEVSERTIRGDIAFLRDRYNAPVEFSKQKGYYYACSDWRLPSISLSMGELFALTLGARILSAYAGSTYENDLKSAVNRLAERLPEQTWVDLQQLAGEQILFRAGAELDLNPEIWHQLEAACQQKRRVWIRYYTAGRNDDSEREIDPYVLHFSRNNPYVTGFCHLRQEVRWFRVDRIKALRLLKDKFEIDPAFDREAHFELAFQHEVGGIPSEIAIYFDAKTAPYIRERRWHPTQQIDEHPDGSLTLHFVARGLNEVKRWILFYGGGAKVLQPVELMELVQKEIQTMQQNYVGE